MSAKQPEPIQFEFDFGESKRECVCAYPRPFDSHVVAFAMARAAAMRAAQQESGTVAAADQQRASVFSIAERLAQIQHARDKMLYDAILDRIKHLPF